MTRLAALLLAAGLAPAADPPKLSARADTLPPPTDLAAAVRELLSDRAVTVADATGAVCTFWLRKEIPVTATKGELTYRTVAPGTPVGAVKLARAWTDFKSQEAPAGVYTLRLAVQPDSKDHEGTAPHRDFVILVPAAADDRADVLPLKEVIRRSGTATGGTHPVVMLLYPHPKPPAEPVVLSRGKKVTAVGVRAAVKAGDRAQDLGFAFTVAGTGVD